jgi:beta-1,4-mannosyltransferase
MQYHALALAHGSAEVDVVGYPGSSIHPSIRDQPRIAWHFLRSNRLTYTGRGRMAFLLSAAAKVVSECVQLVRVLLFRVAGPDVVLVQNPPAIPTLLIAWMAARLRSARLVVDWHNFGYAMLALRLGARHPLVTIARWYERRIGPLADAHLCVSRALQHALQSDWGISRATVLYDRPAEFFGPTPRDVRGALFRRLDRSRSLPASLLVDGDRRKAGGAAVIVSATSWTADEDFSVLLDAARECDTLIHAREDAGRSFPTLVILITGRGPLRAEFEARIAGLALRKVCIQTLWLEPEDYPLLLGAADLGVCLHRSASGLDLPMKIADMFGSGLPVCALDYGPCLAEQMQHGVNGLLFKTSAQLAEQMYRLFERFPESPQLDELRRNVASRSNERWEREWIVNARPLFTE